MHNGNWQLFIQYYNWLFLYALLQLTTFVWTIATKDYCMLQTSIDNISYIDCNYTHKLITAFKYYKLNNSNNNHTLITAKHFHKTRCRQIDRQANIQTYRATFAAKNAKHNCKMQNITTECSNFIDFNIINNNCTLTTT